MMSKDNGFIFEHFGSTVSGDSMEAESICKMRLC